MFNILAVLLAWLATFTALPTCEAESRASSATFTPFDNAELTLFITLPTAPPCSISSAPALAPLKDIWNPLAPHLATFAEPPVATAHRASLPSVPTVNAAPPNTVSAHILFVPNCSKRFKSFSAWE